MSVTPIHEAKSCDPLRRLVVDTYVHLSFLKLGWILGYGVVLTPVQFRGRRGGP